MCSFEPQISFKLTKNTQVILQTKRQYFIACILLLSLVGHWIYGQGSESLNTAMWPTDLSSLASVQDTILEKHANKPLDTIVQDTIHAEQITPAKEKLSDVIDYYGKDYVYFDRKANKVHMYNEAFITYEDMRIDAGHIVMDLSNNTIRAKGIMDTAGVYTQKPKFVQAANEVTPDSIIFNTQTQKALIYNSRTEQSGFHVLAETTKRVNDSVVYVQNARFTTSTNEEDPEYYFLAKKAKFVPKKKIVTGFTNMYIMDVPTPLAMPFGYFPLTESRSSGFIIPTIGDNNRRGFFFQNGGYYFALSDYYDLAVLGDYYTNGSYGLRLESNYSKRYRFNGGISFRYENLVESERGFPDFSQSMIYNLRWNHSQDSKANPSSRFSASVNLGSSKYFQESINQTNNASALVNTLSSTVSYSKTFETNPQINLTIAATHSQNSNTEQINMSLPNINANISKIYPFAPKYGPKQGIIDNISLEYNLTAQNSISTVDSLFFKRDMFRDAKIGAKHTIPISTNFKILKHLSASLSTRFEEVWVGTTYHQFYDENLREGQGGIARDTVRGFDRYHTYNFSASLGTTMYGMFNFKPGSKIQVLRHVMRPNLSYSIIPSFDRYYEELQVPTADPTVAAEIVEFSRFQGSLYGAPSNRFSSNIGFNLSNTLEAKVRSKDSTSKELKKVKLLNNLNMSTSYNVAADSLKLAPLRISGSIPIVEKLDLNFSGALDPYALNNNNQRIDKWNIENGGSLFRLTNANISFNYSFSSKDFEGTKSEEGRAFDSETFRNGGRPDDLFGDTSRGFEDTLEDKSSSRANRSPWYSYSLPWDLRLAYTMTYSNMRRENEISSQSIMFSSNIELAPRWKVGVSSGYDFKNKGVTLTQLRFQRDLESWQMSFNWTPIGSINTSWYFFIGIKSSILSDIKYDKRREPDRRL